MKYINAIIQNVVSEYLILIRRPAGLVFSLFFPTLILVVIALSFPGEFLDITKAEIIIIKNEENEAIVESLEKEISEENFIIHFEDKSLEELENIIRNKEYLLGIYPEISERDYSTKMNIVLDNSNPLSDIFTSVSAGHIFRPNPPFVS